MSFTPINNDHAVQSLVISVIFEKPLGHGVIPYVQGQRDKWPELPAMNAPQTFSFQIGPGGVAPQNLGGQGLELSYQRPDGTPAWLMRFDATGLVVECTRYTRWDRVWEMARKFHHTALEVIQQSQQADDVGVAAVSLQYIDRFVGQAADNDFRTLFCESDIVAKSAFKFGDFWHQHTGWFDRSHELGPILNNLNIDTNSDPASVDKSLSVGILHLQQLRYTEKKSIADFCGSVNVVFDGVMQHLHVQNKSLISSLLSSDMAEKIGLGSSIPTGEGSKS